jgi:uncharacterized protein YndB with AHSA1/START domain
MARNSIRTDASPEEVFDVLDDGRAYADWVVGARRIRSVERAWPEEGSQFHHALGTPALELQDSSEVVTHDRPHRLVLRVRFRPAGEATVDIEVQRDGSGSVVHLTETPAHGLFARLPRLLTDPVVHARNELSLRRLRGLVDERASGTL